MPTDPQDEAERLRRFGARLREARKSRGMTQDQLVEQMGYKDRSYISEYESGKRRLYAHELPAYAEALGVPISALFEDVVEPQNEVEQLALQWLRRLPDEEQLLVVQLLSRIVPVFAEHDANAPTISEILAAYRREGRFGRKSARGLMNNVVDQGKPDEPGRSGPNE